VGAVRLFVAVDPPPTALEVLRRLERPAVPGLRWSKPEQWHVTLRFLGELPAPEPVAGALAAVPAALMAEGVPAVHATLGPASAWFPGRRVLQVPVAGLDGLAAAVADATGSLVPAVDGPPFTGHVTLARVARRSPPGPPGLAGTPVSAHWPVEAISLVRSVVGGPGSRYTHLTSVLLPAVASDPPPASS